jgi:hypothetical protein
VETPAELRLTGAQVVCLSHEPGRPQRNAIPRAFGYGRPLTLPGHHPPRRIPKANGLFAPDGEIDAGARPPLAGGGSERVRLRHGIFSSGLTQRASP